ncbi:MAG: hypothetical protein ABJB74_03785 [Gemmatimonas sp.]
MPESSQPSPGAMRSALEPEIRKLLPKNYPPHPGSYVGDDGIVWLKVVKTPDQFQWWSINASGAPWAAFTMPTGGTLVWKSGDMILVNETDRDDVPGLIRYLLGPAVRR